MPPHAITQRGIGRTFQNIRLFQQMSALENVLVGMHSRLKGRALGAIFGTPRVRREEAAGPRARAWSCSPICGLGRHADEFARNLSYGDQRRLELARALATEPKLLLLDEPTAGMNPQETVDVHGFIRKLRDERELTRPPDRARHARRHGRLRPHDRARLRREDRRGRAAGHPAGPARDRGLPGIGGGEPHDPEGAADPRARGRPHLLRDDRGAQGHLDRGARGRDRHADRRERRGQVDDAALDQRPEPPAPRHDPLPGHGHHADAAARDRPARHLAVAGRSQALPAHDA